MKAWWVFWWLVAPVWGWYVLSRSDEELETVALVVLCVGLLILPLLGG